MAGPGGPADVSQGRQVTAPPATEQGEERAVSRNPEGGRSIEWTFMHEGRRVTVPAYAFSDQGLADQAAAEGYVRIDDLSRDNAAIVPGEAPGVFVPPDVAARYELGSTPGPSDEVARGEGADQALGSVVGGGRPQGVSERVVNPLFADRPEAGGAPLGADDTGPTGDVEIGEPVIIRRTQPDINGVTREGEGGKIPGSRYRLAPEGRFQFHVYVPQSIRPEGGPTFIYVDPYDSQVSPYLRGGSEEVLQGVTEYSYHLTLQ